MTNYADHPDSMVGMVQEMTAANNAWSAEQAQIQRDWQEKMSNTAHQREVADLLAAGLNPAASASTHGASTPTGAKGDTDTSGVGALMSYFTQTTQALINAQTQMAVADKTTAMNELIARLQMQNAQQLQDDQQNWNASHPSSVASLVSGLVGASFGNKHDNSAVNAVQGIHGTLSKGFSGLYNGVSAVHSGLSDVFESGYNSAGSLLSGLKKKLKSYPDSKLREFLDAWADALY